MRLAAATLTLAILLSSCSRSNNLAIGRVEAAIGGHTIVVTDCYRTSVDPPKTEIAAGLTTYSFAPCRDAQVLIRGDQLTVNGQSYGRIGPTDSVLVDHGVVSTHANPAKN
jgi:hypothetical protein